MQASFKLARDIHNKHQLHALHPRNESKHRLSSRPYISSTSQDPHRLYTLSQVTMESQEPNRIIIEQEKDWIRVRQNLKSVVDGLVDEQLNQPGRIENLELRKQVTRRIQKVSSRYVSRVLGSPRFRMDRLWKRPLASPYQTSRSTATTTRST